MDDERRRYLAGRAEVELSNHFTKSEVVRKLREWLAEARDNERVGVEGVQQMLLDIMAEFDLRSIIEQDDSDERPEFDFDTYTSAVAMLLLLAILSLLVRMFRSDESKELADWIDDLRSRLEEQLNTLQER